MQRPEQVQEAAQQILMNASDIQGVLALEGRQDLMGTLLNIQKTAAGIMKMGLPELEQDVREIARRDMMRAIGSLGQAINRNLAEWPNFNGDEVVLIIRMMECGVKRGHAWLEMAVKADEERTGYLKDLEGGCDDESTSR